MKYADYLVERDRILSALPEPFRAAILSVIDDDPELYDETLADFLLHGVRQMADAFKLPVAVFRKQCVTEFNRESHSIMRALVIGDVYGASARASCLLASLES